MTTPSTTWGEIATTTLYNRQKKLADDVTKNNALLARLESKGNVQPFDGGQAIVEEMEYSENGWAVIATNDNVAAWALAA